jgi:hypothetical protein
MIRRVASGLRNFEDGKVDRVALEKNLEEIGGDRWL